MEIFILVITEKNFEVKAQGMIQIRNSFIKSIECLFCKLHKTIARRLNLQMKLNVTVERNIKLSYKTNVS